MISVRKVNNIKEPILVWLPTASTDVYDIRLAQIHGCKLVHKSIKNLWLGNWKYILGWHKVASLHKEFH